jgi:hypothetical protein
LYVFRGKYSRGHPNFDQIVSKTHDSSLWKALVSIWGNFDLYEFWSIGKGNMVKVWEDKWLSQGKSIQDFGIVVPDNL